MVTTNKNVVEALSKQVAEDVLLLQGPGGTQVVVMSPKEYLRRISPEQAMLYDRCPFDAPGSQDCEIVHINTAVRSISE
jgi:hypothetical protein